MKKIASLCLSILLVLAMMVPTFAINKFVPSVEAKPSPEITDSQLADGMEVKVVPYLNRNDLPKDSKDEYEKAYKEIQLSKSPVDVCGELTDVASSKEVETSNLAVSDISYVKYNKSNDSDTNSGTAKNQVSSIKLSADTLKNFVALIRYDGNKWEVDKTAKLDSQNSNISFVVDKSATYAIVVDTAKVKETVSAGNALSFNSANENVSLPNSQAGNTALPNSQSSSDSVVPNSEPINSTNTVAQTESNNKSDSNTSNKETSDEKPLSLIPLTESPVSYVCIGAFAVSLVALIAFTIVYNKKRKA